MDRVRVRARARLGLVTNSVSSGYCFNEYLCNMNIDRNMLVSYDTFNSCCTKRQKTAFFVMDFIKILRNYNFTKMRIKIRYTCDLCVI